MYAPGDGDNSEDGSGAVIKDEGQIKDEEDIEVGKDWVVRGFRGMEKIFSEIEKSFWEIEKLWYGIYWVIIINTVPGLKECI